MSYARKLWAKTPASKSSLFAFQRNGRVGFIDSAGHIAINPTIHVALENIGDFSDGLARVENQGYINEAGQWIIQRVGWMSDFSGGLAQAEIDDPNQKYQKLNLILDLKGQVIGQVPGFQKLKFSEGLAVFEAKGKPGVRKFEKGNFLYRDYPGLKGLSIGLAT